MKNEELQGHIDALVGALARGELQEKHITDPEDAWRYPSADAIYLQARAGEGYIYRIKPPKPREVWIWPKDGVACMGDSRCTVHQAHEAPTNQRLSGGIRFREVIE